MKLYEKISEMKDIIKNYLKKSLELINAFDVERLEDVIKCIGSINHIDNKILIAGNGGSATTASHFAEDMNGSTDITAISLCNDIGFITATSNDFNYDYIFKRQAERLYNDGDILIVFSASGNSKNLIEAVDYVDSMGGLTIGILGFDGGKLIKKCQESLVIETPIGMYPQVEDLHLMITHMMVECFKKERRTRH